MKKNRIFISLAALLATGALAVMPAMAQAEPHYYKNGAVIPEGEKVPLFHWGTLTLTPEPAVAPPTTCDVAAESQVETPLGGGAGAGTFGQISFQECVNAGCPPGEVEIEGTNYEKAFSVTTGPPREFVWSTVLTEPEGKIRTAITQVELSFACGAVNSKRAASGPGENEPIPLAEPTICITDATHHLEPLNENGKNASVTSKLAFGKGAGELSCAGSAVTGKISGTLRTEGFKESEVIVTKNP